MKNGRKITSYDVFDGIRLNYYDISSDKPVINSRDGGETLIISHCRRGRVELEYPDGRFVYISEGDVLIERSDLKTEPSRLFLGRCKGISVEINLERAPACLSCIMEGVCASPRKICDKLCREAPCAVMRSGKETEHIFSELYRVPEKIRHGYLKVKALELLLFLSAAEPNKSNTGARNSLSQLSLAKRARSVLIDNMYRRVTTEELAKMLFVSQTSLKCSFKAVYGESIYAFIKKYRLEYSAHLLRSTDKSVTEIAGEIGYENSSKFSAAFKKQSGLSPNEYRKRCVRTDC